MGLILDGTTGISASGNITGGNIIVTNNFSPAALSVTGNVQGAYIKGNGSELSSINGANVSGDVPAAVYAVTSGSAVGTSATVTTAAQPNITSVGTLTSVTSSGLISTTGTVVGADIVGNGAALSAITGANVTGTVANATYATSAGTAATVTTNAQPNITSVGTLTSVTSSGLISTTGNVSGAYIIGDGSALSAITGANVTGTVANATYATSAGTAATVTTNAQPNITSVGTLTSVIVTGNTESGNIITGGLISAIGNIYGATGTFSAGLQVTGNIDATGNVNYYNVTDLVVGDPLIYMGANNTSNLVDLGIVASATVSGVYQHTGLARDHTDNIWKLFANVTAEPTTVIDWANAVYAPFAAGDITSNATITASGNISGSYIIGNGSALSSITGANVTGTVPAATISATVTTNAQPNITSVGTLTSVTSSGLISTTGNVAGDYILGNGSALSNLTAANITGTVSAASTAGTVTSNAQANITSVGTLTALTVSGLLSAAGNVYTASLGVGTAASGTTGEIRATNNITAYYSSDAKFKTNITPIPGALDKVLAIGGKLFDWTDEYIAAQGGEDGYFVQKSDFGVIAQDVQRVFPQAVRTRQDGSLAVDYEKLCALAFAAIVEQQEQLKEIAVIKAHLGLE